MKQLEDNIDPQVVESRPIGWMVRRKGITLAPVRLEKRTSFDEPILGFTDGVLEKYGYDTGVVLPDEYQDVLVKMNPPNLVRLVCVAIPQGAKIRYDKKTMTGTVLLRNGQEYGSIMYAGWRPLGLLASIGDPGVGVVDINEDDRYKQGR